MTTTRLANIADLNQISTLFDEYRQFYAQSADIELAKSFMSQRLTNLDSVILIAQNESQNLVGFCQIYPSFCSIAAAKIGVLYDLFVQANARKSGVGRALMLAAREHALINDLARLDLTTAKNNLAAQSLYESLGWVRDDVFYTYNKTIS